MEKELLKLSLVSGPLSIYKEIRLQCRTLNQVASFSKCKVWRPKCYLALYIFSKLDKVDQDK